jgi:hypothetical protein
MENEKQYFIVTPPSLAHDSSSLNNKVSEPTTKPKSHQSELHGTPNLNNSEDNEGSADDDEILIVEVQLG